MARLYGILTSTRAAAVLMAAVTFLILLSAIVPQQGGGSGQVKGSGRFLEALEPAMRALGLDRVYGSPVFLGLLVLLTVGLLAGSLRRVGHLKKMRSRKAVLQHLGSVVFHFSLVVILLGVLLNHSFRFEGTFGLTEGQLVADDPGQYVRTASGGLRGDPFGRFSLRLEGIDMHHPVGGTTTEAANVSVFGEPGPPAVTGLVAINAPLRWNGLEFHLGAMIGYSPEIVVLDETGGNLVKNFVRVGGHRNAGGTVLHEDFIDFPAEGRQLGIRVEPGGSPETVPGIALTLLEDGTPIHEGTVAVGDTLQWGSHRVAVPHLRRWCYIQVVENPWIRLVFTGFWVGLAGQALSAAARVLPGKKELEA